MMRERVRYRALMYVVMYVGMLIMYVGMLRERVRYRAMIRYERAREV